MIGFYPDLFHPPADQPGTAAAYPECGQGWLDVLDRACIRIRAAVEADGAPFKFTQIKEKYASLRVDWDGALSPAATAHVENAIVLAEARSACTCEECGEEGFLHQSGDWLTTRCATHAEGKPVDPRPGFENLHIVRQFAAGRMNAITCRRYNRETDSFTDVDPSELGIEEE
ncbi:hypothetical protein [Bradyrhizobium sp. McL0615]|uniref:hypothetical protein n=1 Tax=Bradyrhizobium sp. McL0615 TaxID=3415673 RepID=UPI003CE87321